MEKLHHSFVVSLLLLQLQILKVLASNDKIEPCVDTNGCFNVYDKFQLLNDYKRSFLNLYDSL